MKIDLSYTPDWMVGSAMPESPKGKKKEEPPKVYPSIHLEGDAARKIGCHVETDGEFTALVTFRVVSKRETAERQEGYGKQKEGCSIEMEVRSISSNKIKDTEEEDEEESAEKAADDFFGEE